MKRKPFGLLFYGVLALFFTFYAHSTDAQSYNSQQIVVKYKQPPDFNEAKEARIITSSAQYLGLSSAIEIPQALQNIYIVRLQAGETVSQAIAQYLQDNNVEYAEPLYEYQSLETQHTPNDASIANQYYLNNINAFNAWDNDKGNNTMIIGITDDSFELTHGDLTGKSVAGYDVANGDADVSGTTAHGTQVAGVAVANTNNSLGIAGVGYDCRFMPIKVSTDASPTSYAYGMQGVWYAAQNGCKVINMSWGRVGSPSRFEQDVLRAAVEQYDVVLVAAGGNDGTENLYYPAAYSEYVLAVAGTDAADNRWSNATLNEKMGIAAPADNIYTTTTGNAYFYASGTSFATPMVSATAALLRLKYPTWKASQIIAQLKATARVANAQTSFEGKMGAGILDMHNALENNTKKYLSIQAAWLNKGVSNGTQNLLLQLSNQLNPTTNLQATLSTTSPHITIIDNQVALGSLATLQSMVTQTDVFTLQISPSIPNNTVVVFQVTFQDGGTLHTEYLRFILPDTKTLSLSVNQIALAVDEKGNTNPYNPNSPTEIGFRYKNQQLLSESGIVIATSSSKISNTLRENTTTTTQSFTKLKNIAYNSLSNSTFQEIHAQYEDITNNADRLLIEVFSKIYAWKEAPNDKFAIIELQVKNVGNTTLNNIYTGFFANWNIQNYLTNKADYEVSRRLGYAYHTGGIYAGIVLLSTQTPHFYAIDNDGSNGSININNDFTKAEKFQTISSGIARSQAGGVSGSDVATIIAAQIPSLAVGETQTVAFAWVVGDNLTDLQTQATAAQNKFKEVKTATAPTFSTLQICQGTSLTISPNGGSLFNFYTAPPPSGLIASKVRSLRLNNITQNTTLYISNADSLYESQANTLNIQSGLRAKAAFLLSSNTLDLSRNDTLLTLQNQSANATQYLWKLNDGRTSTLASPTFGFKQAGVYTLQLIANNAQGCADSLSQTITVAGILPQPLITDLSNLSSNNYYTLYPTPAEDYLYLKYNTSSQTPFALSLYNSEGKKLQSHLLSPFSNLCRVPIQLPEGMYLCQIEWTNGESTWDKIIVKSKK